MQHIRQLLRLLVVASLTIGLPAVASTDIRWLPETGSQGLTVNLPHIDRDVLVMRLSQLQAGLEEDKLSLGREVEKTRIKDKDMALAAVLPGGLIYAAIRKSNHNRAVKQFEHFNSELNEIEQDIRVLAGSRVGLRALR